MTAPAMIVIGTQNGGLIRGLTGFVGMQHVDPPKPWDETGEFDARSEAALTEMEQDGLDPNLRDWFTGHLRPDDARKYGIDPEFDTRSVAIFSAIREAKEAARRGVLTVDRNRQRVKRQVLCGIAAELAIRPCRAEISRELRPRDLKVVRGALQRFYESFWDEEWHASARTIEDVREAAEQELNDGGVGPSCRELALLAAYHVLRLKLLFPLPYARQQLIAQNDGVGLDREVHTVVRSLIATEHGIHQLAQIILDAREGLRPRRVSFDGAVVKSNGTAVTLREQHLREDAHPQSPTVKVPEAPNVQIPQRTLVEQRARLSEAISSAVALVPVIERIGEPPLILTDGWNSDDVAELQHGLRLVDKALTKWGFIWDQTQRNVELGASTTTLEFDE